MNREKERQQVDWFVTIVWVITGSLLAAVWIRIAQWFPTWLDHVLDAAYRLAH